MKLSALLTLKVFPTQADSLQAQPRLFRSALCRRCARRLHWIAAEDRAARLQARQ